MNRGHWGGPNRKEYKTELERLNLRQLARKFAAVENLESDGELVWEFWRRLSYLPCLNSGEMARVVIRRICDDYEAGRAKSSYLRMHRLRATGRA